MLDLLHKLRIELLDILNVLVILGGGGNREQPVVPLRFPVFGLLSLNHADKSRRHETASKGRFVHEDQDIQRITILAESGRDKAIVKGKDGAGGQDFVELKMPRVGSYLNLLRFPLGVSTMAFKRPDWSSSAPRLAKGKYLAFIFERSQSVQTLQ